MISDRLTLAAAAVVLAAAVSCTKTDALSSGQEAVSGETVTISASIGDQLTKTSYEDTDGILKSTWSTGDRISVITFDREGGEDIILAVDYFSITDGAGSEYAEFTGTLTDVSEEHPDAKRICYYPSLASGLDEKGVKYYCQYKVRNKPAGDIFRIGESVYPHSYDVEAIPGDLSKMDDEDVMTGNLEGDVSEGYHASLSKLTYVVKLDLDLAAYAGEKIAGYKLWSSASNFYYDSVEIGDNGSFNYVSAATGAESDLNYVNALYSSKTFTIPSDGKVVAYIPLKNEFSVRSTDVFGIGVMKLDVDSNRMVPLAYSLRTPSSELKFEKGKIYTLKSSFVASDLTEAVLVLDSGVGDDTFREYLAENFDLDGDRKLTKAEARLINTIDLTGCDDISGLSGIEKLTSLKHLDCSSQKISWFDLSSNVNLETLDCSNNSLTSLSLIDNPKLTELNFNGNNISTLNLRMNTKLVSLSCSFNNLTSLDLVNNVMLQTLECYDNESLTALDLSTNTRLESLECSGTAITELNLSNNPELYDLECGSNEHLTTINVNSNINLQYLDCSETGITTLDLSNNLMLEDVDCSDCDALTVIYVSADQDYSTWEYPEETRIEVFSHYGTENGHEWVRLWAGGPKWATMNIGASEATGYGSYYKCGYTDVYDSSSEYKTITSDYARTEGDVAWKTWNAEGTTATTNVWQIPNSSDFNALLSTDNTNGGTWVTNYNGSGINGYLIKGKDNYADAVLFLPAAGYYHDGASNEIAESGEYRTSTPNRYSGQYSDLFYFESDSHGVSTMLPNKDGCSIRPVFK